MLRLGAGIFCSSYSRLPLFNGTRTLYAPRLTRAGKGWRMPLVCIDCRYIGPKPSGIAKVVQALVDHVPELAPDLDFLLLKNPKLSKQLSTAENVTEAVVNAAANSPTTMWRLPSVADLSLVDLFHATFNIMPARLHMPCVTTVHDIMWLTNPEWCNSRFSSLLERFFYQHGIRRALERSAAIATVSEASRHAIESYAPHVAHRIHVTPLGVSRAYRQVAFQPEELARLGLSPGRSFVLCVGQYVPYKNHEGALRIFAEAAASLDHIDLVFVQRLNRYSDDLRRLAATLGLADRVHFLPLVHQGDLTLLLNAAEVLLHPSYCEGFGLPLVEAMACGCPVVTSNQSAMPEVVGDAGLLADPYDVRAMATALRSVIEDPSVASEMKEKGLQRAASFQWREFARDNLEIYRRVLRQSPEI
jgi:alpha-1,3-rhamnosyl/mannosyltransferase